MKHEQKRDHERQVADTFCAWLAEDTQLPCAVLAQRDAPDFEITHGPNRLFLELAEYRERGSYNELQDKNDRFVAQLRAILREAGLQYTVWFSYREESYKGISFPSNSKCWPAIGCELVSLINGLADAFPLLKHFRCHFRSRSNVRNKKTYLSGYHFLANEEYPILSTYCRGITFAPRSGLFPDVHSLRTRMYGPDFDAVIDVIDRKCAKSQEYVKETDGAPVGLLYYATGHCNSRIPPRLYDEQFKEHIAQVIGNSDHSFSHVWWAIDLFIEDNLKVWKIL